MDKKSIQFNLYLLRRNDTPMAGEVTAFVVSAPSEEAARKAANESEGGYTQVGYIWTDGRLVDAQFLGTAADGVAGVILPSTKE